MSLRLEPRLISPRWLQVLAPGLSFLLALLAVAWLFLALGVDPLSAYYRILTGAFGSWFGLTETLVKTIPLMLTGVGLALAFRARIYNIGAEGQLLLGATLATSLALRYPDLPAWILLPGMFAAGFLGGAFWASIPAILKARFRVDEVLTSLMLVYIAIELVTYLVVGPWKGASQMGFPYTEVFSASAQLPSLGTSRVHYPTLLLALCSAGLVYLLLARTRSGYEIRVTGQNPEAARYASMSYTKTALTVMVISGGLAGLAGVGEVAGIHYRLGYPQAISAGYGFTAIIVAWLARLNPLAVIPTSFLLGGLLVGGDAIQVAMRLPATTVNLFNGVILLFVLGGDLITRYQVSLVRRRDG